MRASLFSDLWLYLSRFAFNLLDDECKPGLIGISLLLIDNFLIFFEELLWLSFKLELSITLLISVKSETRESEI